MAAVLEPKTKSTEGALVVHLRSVIEMDDDQFFEFTQLNRELRIERNAEGELIIMPPTGWETGGRNAEITMQLRAWAKRNGQGEAVDSSTGYRLPNAATLSPDASWVRQDRLRKISPQQKKKFLPLCPDFVIELESPTDRLDKLQDKMQEWLDNGAQLAWLIDPQAKRVYVYRPNAEMESIENAKAISGEPVLKEFVLDLTQVW